MSCIARDISCLMYTYYVVCVPVVAYVLSIVDEILIDKPSSIHICIVYSIYIYDITFDTYNICFALVYTPYNTMLLYIIL